MRKVILLLWIKIIGTALLAALPMLLTPEPAYRWLGFPEQPMLFLRLYALSTIALLVGYYGGIEQARRGEFPRGVLRMGLVSNGGQGLAIVLFGAMGAFTAWGVLAQLMMWSVGLFVVGIAIAIVLAQRAQARLPPQTK